MPPACQIGALTIGPAPAVVGVVSRADTLAALRGEAPRCDIVEWRADLIGPMLDAALESDPAPLRPRLLTVRCAREGGRWSGSEEERIARYEMLLPFVQAVDVEIESDAFSPVAAAARAADRRVVASFHDYAATPDAGRLRALIKRGVDLGADIVKLAVWTYVEEDVRRLEDLFLDPLPVPLAAMGMGPLGAASRTRLAAAGSCLVYGYLDESTAPGQLAAGEWVDRLLETLPAYRAAHSHA